MACSLKSYDIVTLYNIWDPEIDPAWKEANADKYLENVADPEWITNQPKTAEGNPISQWQIRQLTGRELNYVENLHGQDKLNEICRFGLVGFSGFSKGNAELKCMKEKHPVFGTEVTSLDTVLEFGFFFLMEISLKAFCALKILHISRSNLI